MNELTIENFDILDLNELESIDGGLAITTGGLIAIGCFAVGTVAGLIWG